ncbi:hypothetical protein VTJ83DRAFT_3900 [Remersonia thermophila]|uniref:N-acetyltransferase domain-containing protein n=1 Tax=Remersonia thermophila TaxID=72144 RepID=A0ABR4DHL9_9PEZI
MPMYIVGGQGVLSGSTRFLTSAPPPHILGSPFESPTSNQQGETTPRLLNATNVQGASTEMAQPLGLTASDVVFDEATPEQRLLAWELCAQSWAKPMSVADYIERERRLAEHDLNRDGGCRHWVLYLKGYPRLLIASCESTRRPVLISDGSGKPCREAYGYAVTNVYTAPSYRRQGYAAYLLRCIQKRMDAEGEFSVLYSDSGRRYYAGLGWIPFAARQATITLLTPQSPPQLQVPGRLFAPVRVKTRPLQAEELPALCEADCRHLAAKAFSPLGAAAGSNDDRIRIAFLPTHALVSWHLASAEFDAAKMFPAPSPASKPVPGAIVTPSHRAWACWAHDWRGRRLRVLRIAHAAAAAADDPGSDEGGSPPRTAGGATATATAVADVAALLEAAVDEARRCGLRSVTVWNPDDVVRAGCKGVGNALEGEVKVVFEERVDGGIPSLRWKGGVRVRGVVWEEHFGYCWC